MAVIPTIAKIGYGYEMTTGLTGIPLPSSGPGLSITHVTRAILDMNIVVELGKDWMRTDRQ
jgi:hypothetical protein